MQIDVDQTDKAQKRHQIKSGEQSCKTRGKIDNAIVFADVGDGIQAKVAAEADINRLGHAAFGGIEFDVGQFDHGHFVPHNVDLEGVEIKSEIEAVNPRFQLERDPVGIADFHRRILDFDGEIAVDQGGNNGKNNVFGQRDPRFIGSDQQLKRNGFGVVERCVIGNRAEIVQRSDAERSGFSRVRRIDDLVAVDGRRFAGFVEDKPAFNQIFDQRARVGQTDARHAEIRQIEIKIAIEIVDSENFFSRIGIGDDKGEFGVVQVVDLAAVEVDVGFEAVGQIEQRFGRVETQAQPFDQTGDQSVEIIVGIGRRVGRHLDVAADFQTDAQRVDELIDVGIGTDVKSEVAVNIVDFADVEFEVFDQFCLDRNRVDVVADAVEDGKVDLDVSVVGRFSDNLDLKRGADFGHCNGHVEHCHQNAEELRVECDFELLQGIVNRHAFQSVGNQGKNVESVLYDFAFRPRAGFVAVLGEQVGCVFARPGEEIFSDHIRRENIIDQLLRRAERIRRFLRFGPALTGVDDAGDQRNNVDIAEGVGKPDVGDFEFGEGPDKVESGIGILQFFDVLQVEIKRIVTAVVVDHHEVGAVALRISVIENRDDVDLVELQNIEVGFDFVTEPHFVGKGHADAEAYVFEEERHHPRQVDAAVGFFKPEIEVAAELRAVVTRIEGIDIGVAVAFGSAVHHLVVVEYGGGEIPDVVEFQSEADAVGQLDAEFDRMENVVLIEGKMNAFESEFFSAEVNEHPQKGVDRFVVEIERNDTRLSFGQIDIADEEGDQPHDVESAAFGAALGALFAFVKDVGGGIPFGRSRIVGIEIGINHAEIARKQLRDVDSRHLEVGDQLNVVGVLECLHIDI